jgi:hypothetical protein
MTYNDLYEACGRSHKKVSEVTGFCYSAVRNWMYQEEIPLKSQILIQKRTKGKFKASIQDLKDYQ